MADSYIRELLRASPPPLRPLVQFNQNKINRGSTPLSNLQFSMAAAAIQNRHPIIQKRDRSPSIMEDITSFPGNFIKDASETFQGFLSPWKWAPAIAHNIASGNLEKILPLIPGYTTASNLAQGHFHEIAQHPVGTLLDVLPYAHAGLKAIGEATVPTDEAAIAERAANPLGRLARQRNAIEAGKPGSTLYNLLPEKIVSPEEGIIGKKIGDFRQAAEVAKVNAINNRSFQKDYGNYLDSVKTITKDFTPEDHTLFYDYLQNRNPSTPGVFTDAKGVVKEVPQHLQTAADEFIPVQKKLENLAQDYTTKVIHKNNSYIYSNDSPVVKQLNKVGDLTGKVVQAKTALDATRNAWVEHFGMRVQPKTEGGLVVKRSQAKLFQVKDQIDRKQTQLEKLYNKQNRETNHVKYVQTVAKIRTVEGDTARLQAIHDTLSAREMLHHKLSTDPNYHLQPEDYHLLQIRLPGEIKPSNAYLKAARNHEIALKDLADAHAQYGKLLHSTAPAVFMPAIKDKIFAKIYQKIQENDSTFLPGSGNWDWNTTRSAIEQRTSGADPVMAGLISQKEVDAITRETEATWQEMADRGLNPIYVSDVNPNRLHTVLDPNLFHAGAVKDQPYAVQSRTANITPSGVKSPVVGLVAPAIALLRKAHLQELYNTYLSKFVKSESDLHNWLDTEMARTDMTKLKPGETLMSRRQAIKQDRWREFDRTKIDPDLAAMFPKGEKVYLPKAVYDPIVKLYNPNMKQLETVSQANLRGMRIFRTAILALSVKHLAHISFGGFTQLLLRGGMEELSIPRMRAAWHMAKDEMFPRELSTGVDFYSSHQLKNEAGLANQPVNALQKAARMFGNTVTNVQHFEEQISNFERSLSYMSELDRIMQKGRRSADLSFIENGEVKAALAKGDTAQALDLAKRGAIRHANKALVDFDSMLPAERGIIRQVFPFYAFTRHIFKYAMTYPIDYPLRASFIYRLGELTQNEMENQGLPDDWMRYLSFGPDQSGNVTNVDLRFLNPFRSIPDTANLSGISNSLNPFLGAALEWAGLDPFTTSPNRFPEIRYNPKTGYVETKRPGFGPLDLLTKFIPELSFTNSTSTQPTWNQLPHYAFLPGWPYRMNENMQRAKGELGLLEEAQQAVANAVKTGNTDQLRNYNMVPIEGQMVPGQVLAQIIDNLPSGPSRHQQLYG